MILWFDQKDVIVSDVMAGDLRKLSDDQLLRQLAALLGQSRRIEWELVAHIGEVEARRLFAREACESMFVYCTDVLHLSEHEAYLRIAVARAAREHPMLLMMLGDGRLHLSAIAKLAPHLTVANREALLAQATHRSKRQIEVLVADLAPRPDVPASIRKLRLARLPCRSWRLRRLRRSLLRRITATNSVRTEFRLRCRLRL